MPRRFKRAIYAIDSSTIKLVANCVDWAKHRRRKAAAKLHLQLDLRSYLPSFAIVDTAKHSDPRRARELCANLKDGEIALFDKAYVDFKHLIDLTHRGVFWVTRAKDNMDYRVKHRNIKKRCGNILRDDLHHQQHKLGTVECRRPVQKSMVDRNVFQGDQTDVAAKRLPSALSTP